LIFASQAVNFEKIGRVLKEGYEVMFAVRGEDRKWSTEITMNEFEKLRGLRSRRRRMGRTSVLADDARLTFWQFITGRKLYTLDGVNKIASGSFPNVSHAMMPQIHGFDDFGEESGLNGTRREDEFEIDKIQFIVRLNAFVNTNASPIRILPHDFKPPVIKDASYFAANGCHPADGKKVYACRRSV
jgi:hypothetical protein